MNWKVLTLVLITVVSLSSFKGEKKEKGKSTAVATQNVTGCIVDKISGETLVGVEVSLDGTDMKTYTDFDGNFSFENVSVGDHKISAKLISYNEIKEKEIKVDVVKDEDLKISMSQVN